MRNKNSIQSVDHFTVIGLTYIHIYTYTYINIIYMNIYFANEIIDETLMVFSSTMSNFAFF